MKDAKNMTGDGSVEMEIALWDYIDGRATTKEREAIDQLLRERSDWASKYSELLETADQLSGIEVEQPSMRFTKNVMEEISKYSIAPATRAYINKNIIRSIGFFFVTSICALVAYGFKEAFSSPQNTATGQATGTAIDYSAIFNGSYVSIFMMLNILLALLLLDRYLRKKHGLAREF